MEQVSLMLSTRKGKPEICRHKRLEGKTCDLNSGNDNSSFGCRRQEHYASLISISSLAGFLPFQIPMPSLPWDLGGGDFRIFFS